MKKKIIILGASRYYLKSIEAARAAGYYVIALDRNPQSEGFKAADKSYTCDITDQQGVLKIALKHNISGIIPLNDIGVPVASFVSEILNIPGISKQAVIWATNKEEMRKRWIEKGVPCPKVVVAVERSDFYKGVDFVGFPCILKPAHGLGGASRGVIVVNSKDELETAIDFSQGFYEDKATLIETFVDAEYEHSAEVLIYKGIPYVIAISDKIKTPLPYRVDKNVIYPTLVSEERLEKLKKVICDAVQALNINIGAAHVELATTKDGFCLFELGARCGGGGTPEPIVHFSTGINQFVELIRILTGSEPLQLTPIYNRGANYHFLIPNTGEIKSVTGIEEIKNMPGILDAEFFKSEGDFISEVTVGTERSGFIIAVGQTREEAINNAAEAERVLQIQLK